MATSPTASFLTSVICSLIQFKSFNSTSLCKRSKKSLILCDKNLQQHNYNIHSYMRSNKRIRCALACKQCKIYNNLQQHSQVITHPSLNLSLFISSEATHNTKADFQRTVALVHDIMIFFLLKYARTCVSYTPSVKKYREY